ncbi:MAG: hypothetical protein IKP20_03780 [Candidatus Methanomethylophilaceae archaeon]|nr:hypothetical protein [Candidatus Methanomethylophilaceae archaeon]
MRREEVVALRWEKLLGAQYIRIDSAVRSLPGKGILVKDPKSIHSRRKYAMTAFLRDLIMQWNRECGGVSEGYLFPSPTVTGNPVFPDTITSHTASLSKRLGFRVTPT